MHFISVEHARDEETGQLHGCRLKLQPLLEESNAASTAIYGELWHRLRRDNVLTCQIDQSNRVFDASLYFKGISGTNCDTIDAAILLNNATGTDNFQLHHADAEDTVTEWLHRMDSLLVQLLQHEDYAPQLRAIAHRFVTETRDQANIELKDILKRYCREQGLYVDASDISNARAQLKERRRQIFQAGVETGQIQIPRRGRQRQRPTPPAE